VVKVESGKVFEAKSIFGFYWKIQSDLLRNIVCINYTIKSVLEKIWLNHNEKN